MSTDRDLTMGPRPKKGGCWVSARPEIFAPTRSYEVVLGPITPSLDPGAENAIHTRSVVRA